MKHLGKRPPVNRPTVDIGDFLRLDKIPDHPTHSPAPNLHFPMDRNDQAGCCVVAGLDHTLQTIDTALGGKRANWTDAQLLDLYRTQNPDFHSWDQGGTDADGGMVIQTFLEELVRRGEIVAFGKIDHRNDELMRAAIYVGLSIVTGEDLRAAQENQRIWAFVDGSPEWGGHCTCSVGYDEQYGYVVTWGEVLPITDSFKDHQMDEAWLVLTQAHLDHPGFRNAFDLAGFAAAVSDLTGGKVVVPVGPTPTPTPQPIPDGPALAAFPFSVADQWIARHSYTKREKVAKAAIAAWMKTYLS